MVTEKELLTKRFPALAKPLAAILPALEPYRASAVELFNQERVLAAFTEERVSSYDLLGSTGYGYNDSGRDKLEAIYCRVFGGQQALVRPQIASGTHALWLALSGNIQPGEEIISLTGAPYATLTTVLSQKGPGSFEQLGIKFKAINLLPDGTIDYRTAADQLTSQTKIVYLQKSRGYSLRPPLSAKEMRPLATWLESRGAPVLVVDNCYGEFVEAGEPGQFGADLVVGSLIKNPGGGLAETGGYLVGRADLVANACDRLLAPGLAGEIGATGNYLRGMYQGLFLAPHFVGQALYNARFAAALGEQLGFKTWPHWQEDRYDLVQAIELGSAEDMIKFCQTIQSVSPIDSYAAPIPAPMPGYQAPVIMAAGTFVQGASLELSADGPVEPPYIVYFQGGLSIQHGMLALAAAFASVL